MEIVAGLHALTGKGEFKMIDARLKSFYGIKQAIRDLQFWLMTNLGESRPMPAKWPPPEFSTNSRRMGHGKWLTASPQNSEMPSSITMSMIWRCWPSSEHLRNGNITFTGRTLR